jgi:hypothetical protein
MLRDLFNSCYLPTTIPTLLLGSCSILIPAPMFYETGATIFFMGKPYCMISLWRAMFNRLTDVRDSSVSYNSANSTINSFLHSDIATQILQILHKYTDTNYRNGVQNKKYALLFLLGNLMITSKRGFISSSCATGKLLVRVSLKGRYPPPIVFK